MNTIENFKENLRLNGWCDELKKELKTNHIYYKENEINDLVILYNNYQDLFTSGLNRLIRSVIISKNEKRIISYSCASPIENDDGLNIVIRNNARMIEPIITECYEGTYLSLFYYDKWYLSTRKCLDARLSKFKDKSYFELFEKVLNMDGYTFDSFTEKLNKNNSYYFILLDSENVNIVNYDYLFGENYSKLVFTYERDNQQKIITKMDYSEVPEFTSDNIIIPRVIDDISYLDKYNEENCWNLPVKSEGIILRYPDETLVKLQSLNYQFAKAIGIEENLYLGLLKMYQSDKLIDYIKSNEKFEKIVNPLNSYESYYTIGIINSIFRTLTTEIYALYNMLYDEKCNTLNKGLYNLLPKEYKYYLFKLRGIHFKKINIDKLITEKDVYFLIKKSPVENISILLRMRKLMHNLVYQNKFDDNLKLFKSISKNVDKLSNKLVNIFIGKLYPEIMDKDIPLKLN